MPRKRRWYRHRPDKYRADSIVNRIDYTRRLYVARKLCLGRWVSVEHQKGEDKQHENEEYKSDINFRGQDRPVQKSTSRQPIYRGSELYVKYWKYPMGIISVFRHENQAPVEDYRLPGGHAPGAGDVVTKLWAMDKPLHMFAYIIFF